MNHISEKIQTIVKNHIFEGIVLLLIGLFLLLWPQASLKILCIVIGAFLIILGGIRLIGELRNKDGSTSQYSFPFAVFLLILGILLIVLSRFFVSVILILTGLVLLFGCIMMFKNAYDQRQIRGQGFYLSLIPAVLILILAIVMIINPVGTASFVIQMVGVAVIIEGLFMLFTYKENGE